MTKAEIKANKEEISNKVVDYFKSCGVDIMEFTKEQQEKMIVSVSASMLAGRV